MSLLALKKLNAFSVGHGWLFWNFKTELEPKWDYIRAVEAGWLPRDAQAASDDVRLACEVRAAAAVAVLRAPARVLAPCCCGARALAAACRS
jgi:glucan 1,3-beta-glucosidase